MQTLVISVLTLDRKLLKQHVTAMRLAQGLPGPGSDGSEMTALKMRIVLNWKFTKTQGEQPPGHRSFSFAANGTGEKPGEVGAW